MAVELTSREIAEKYDGFARRHDWIEGVPDLLGVGKLRQQLLPRARGRVLEAAVGTGKNFPYYPRGSRIFATDISRGMLKIARRRAAALSMEVSFVLADGEALPFRGSSFDTVVSSLSTCTFPNPVLAVPKPA
jgi:ubiquinone/menaquinone biosynthesis C-methylase UbiE